MSVDVTVYMPVDTGGEEEARLELWDGNMTSNVAPMWYDAGWTFHDIDGLPVADLIPKARAALELLKANPEKYKAMDSPNGWGTYEDMLPFFTEMVEAMEAHPKASIHVWL